MGSWVYRYDQLSDEYDRAEQHIKKLEEALREVTRLSGTDLSDGFPTWPPLHEFAVQEIKQLREDYDEACERLWEQERTMGDRKFWRLP